MLKITGMDAVLNEDIPGKSGICPESGISEVSIQIGERSILPVVPKLITRLPLVFALFMDVICFDSPGIERIAARVAGALVIYR